MTDAVLIVASSSTACSNCNQSVLPDSLTHGTVSGYGPPREGCGALFTAITTGYTDIPVEILQEMRPDLPVLTWREYVERNF